MAEKPTQDNGKAITATVEEPSLEEVPSEKRTRVYIEAHQNVEKIKLGWRSYGVLLLTALA